MKYKLAQSALNISLKKIRSYLDDNGLICVSKTKYKATTNSKHNYLIAPNSLNKD